MIEINRRKSLRVYRINPYNAREIDWRENRHGARWQRYCTCASEDEARAEVVKIGREAKQ